MLTSNVKVLVLVASLAACGRSELDHLENALDGNPDETTGRAAAELSPVLSVADWYYLANAEWPADASVVIADPVLQKAMNMFTPPLPLSGRLAAPANPAPPPTIQDLLDQARALMADANRRAAAAGYPSAVAFAQAMGQAMPRPFPPAGPPADGTTHTETVEYYNNGKPPTRTSTNAPLCCRGELTFPPGSFVCYDSTSCQGAGDPPPGGLTTTLNYPAPGGGGGGGSFTCAKSNPQVTCQGAAGCSRCSVSACGGPDGSACSFALTSDGMHEMTFGTDCGPQNGCPGSNCNTAGFNACVNAAIQQSLSQCGCT